MGGKCEITWLLGLPVQGLSQQMTIDSGPPNWTLAWEIICPNSALHLPSGTSRSCSPLPTQAFGISEPEALLLDPQQRLTLEAVHEALSASSSVPAAAAAAPAATMGVYVGVASSDHGAVVARHATSGSPQSAAGPYHASANALSVVAGRVSFVFGLTGAPWLVLRPAVPFLWAPWSPQISPYHDAHL